MNLSNIDQTISQLILEHNVEYSCFCWPLPNLVLRACNLRGLISLLRPPYHQAIGTMGRSPDILDRCAIDTFETRELFTNIQ